MNTSAPIAYDDDHGPWPFDMRDLGALIASVYRVNIGSANRAAEHWIRNVETNWSRSIDRHNLSATDVAAVLEAVSEARP